MSAGYISKDQIWRILRKHSICLERRRIWCISTDPEFGPKAADVVGLYLAPPANAPVLSVDEKPFIKALERAQGYLRLPDGKAVNGFSHCYKRHGTTTLFAALEVTTGLVKTAHYQRRRRREFPDFMNEIVAGHADREIHVILDNLNTRKPKDDRWLKRHKNVHFHFIPTYSSWLNQVECWFSILSRQALQGASFTPPQQLRRAIDNFVAAYNKKAAPSEWRKAVVFPSAPKRKYADLCNQYIVSLKHNYLMMFLLRWGHAPRIETSGTGFDCRGKSLFGSVAAVAHCGDAGCTACTDLMALPLG
jgi:transposase